METADVTAIVPIKALEAAKSRMRSTLSAGQRRELVEWMAHRVLEACRGCAFVSRLVVVAGDQPTADAVRSYADAVIVPPQPGLNLAVSTADAQVTTSASLVVAADLPLADAATLNRVCKVGSEDGTVVITPTTDGGTGSLFRRPPHSIAPGFGPGSAMRHKERAAIQGLNVHILHEPALALDVDTPASLSSARAHSPTFDRWVRARLGS